MKRIGCVVASVAVLMLTLAAPALADPPVSVDVPVAGDCGGVGFEGTLTVRQLTTASGIVHTNVDGVLAGSNGVNVRVHHAWTETASAVVGLPFSERADRLSVRDAGLIRLSDGFVAGPHQLLFEFGLDPEAATCYLIASA